MEEKQTKITINFYRYATPMNYAAFKGVSKQVVNNWVNRGQVETLFIQGLGLTLIKIPTAELQDRKVWIDKNTYNW